MLLVNHFKEVGGKHTMANGGYTYMVMVSFTNLGIITFLA
jgi:hypothetical protein